MCCRQFASFRHCDCVTVHCQVDTVTSVTRHSDWSTVRTPFVPAVEQYTVPTVVVDPGMSISRVPVERIRTPLPVLLLMTVSGKPAVASPI